MLRRDVRAEAARAVAGAPGVSWLRTRLATAVRDRVNGPAGPAEAARIFAAPGPRWFAADRPIRHVHSDAAMMVGGMRALLLQTLHPLAMAGVADHDSYRSDPWRRLQRTAAFLARTTYGPAAEAERAVAAVRAVHRSVRGVAPDGRPYAADDPHLLRWVHVAEVDSFLVAHERFGRRPLSAAEADGYVVDMGVVAARLGVVDPPRTVADIHRELAAFRPELRGTLTARDAARFILFPRPLAPAARPAYSLLAAGAVALLPAWARAELDLRGSPAVERATVLPAARGVVRLLGWAIAPHPAAADWSARRVSAA